MCVEQWWSGHWQGNGGVVIGMGNGGVVIGRGKVEWSLAGERWNGYWQGQGGMVIAKGKVEWSLAGESRRDLRRNP